MISPWRFPPPTRAAATRLGSPSQAGADEEVLERSSFQQPAGSGEGEVREARRIPEGSSSSLARASFGIWSVCQIGPAGLQRRAGHQEAARMSAGSPQEHPAGRTSTLRSHFGSSHKRFGLRALAFFFRSPRADHIRCVVAAAVGQPPLHCIPGVRRGATANGKSNQKRGGFCKKSDKFLCIITVQSP